MGDIGDIIGSTVEGNKGSYRITEKIGEGTFANVYLIENGNGDSYCLKKIKDFGDWKAHELAKREAEVLRENTHPGSPKFHDFFEDGLTTYLVMEHIEGRNLKDLVTSGKRFSESEMIDLGAQVLEILSDFHMRGIIHRDLKPSNIILNDQGKVKIIDWGSVKFDSTEGSTVAGTSGYAPFETFCGRAVPASDIFSWGRTMLYLASAVDPLEMDENGNGEIAMRKYLGTRLSEDFSDILEKSCKMLPKDRYHSAKETMDAVKKIDLSSRLRELGRGVKYDGKRIFIPEVDKLERALVIAKDIDCEMVRVPVLNTERRSLDEQYDLTSVNEGYGTGSEGFWAKVVNYGKVLTYPLLGSLPASLQREIEKRLNNGQKTNFNAYHASIASGVFEMVAGLGAIIYAATSGDATGYFVGGGLVGESIVRRRLSLDYTESECEGCPLSIVCPVIHLSGHPRNEPLGTLLGKVVCSPVEYAIKKNSYEPKKLVDVSVDKVPLLT